MGRNKLLAETIFVVVCYRRTVPRETKRQRFVFQWKRERDGAKRSKAWTDKDDAWVQCKPDRAHKRQTGIRTREQERHILAAGCGADEKNNWSVSGEVLQRHRRWKILRSIPAPCHDQTMHWMIYFPHAILSPWREKKNLHSIKLLRVLFWKGNVIVGVGVSG